MSKVRRIDYNNESSRLERIVTRGYVLRSEIAAIIAEIEGAVLERTPTAKLLRPLISETASTNFAPIAREIGIVNLPPLVAEMEVT